MFCLLKFLQVASGEHFVHFKIDYARRIEINLNNWILKTFFGWLIGFVLMDVLAMLPNSMGVSLQFFVGTKMPVLDSCKLKF